MVLLVNICCGQFVDVCVGDKIVCGIVRYKGHLNSEVGDWVGVELEYPLGKHNGCWRGRQYFKAPNNCGLFTHACNIRFRRLSRKSRDTYRKSKDACLSSERQFCTKESAPELSPCYSISKEYLTRSQSAFEPLGDDMFSQSERYPLRHSVSRFLPASTTVIPPGSPQSCSIAKRGVYWELNDPGASYTSLNASIPHYTMPHEVMLRQMRRGGWGKYGLSQPRFMSV